MHLINNASQFYHLAHIFYFTFQIPNTEQLSTVSVSIFLESSPDAVTGASGDFQTFGAGVSLVPLIIILFLAMTTQMVELSLFCGIWLGACILTGSFRAGFESTIYDFLVGALADEWHVQVILFTVFLSGAVGMMVRKEIAFKIAFEIPIEIADQ